MVSVSLPSNTSIPKTVRVYVTPGTKSGKPTVNGVSKSPVKVHDSEKEYYCCKWTFIGQTRFVSVSSIIGHHEYVCLAWMTVRVDGAVHKWLIMQVTSPCRAVDYSVR